MNIQELETIEADWKEIVGAFNGAGCAESYTEIVDMPIPLLIAEVRRLKTEMNKIATAAREAAE